jgi:hypothetical protein
MMRLPAPVILAALVIVATGTVVLNLDVNYDVYYYEINATGLKLHEARLYYLDFVPAKIYLIGDPSKRYCVTVYVTNAFLEDENGKATPYVEYCDYGESTFGEYRVISVWGPVNATIRVTRVT